MRTIFLLAFAYCVATRVGELFLSRRNEKRAAAAGGYKVKPDGTGTLVAVHVLWLVGLLVEELTIGPRDWPMAVNVTFGVLAVVAELGRLTCLMTLGERWMVGVMVWPTAPLVQKGPYRIINHPNYFFATLLLLSLPLALGLPLVAAVMVPLKILAVRRRISIENGALRPEAASGAPSGASGGI